MVKKEERCVTLLALFVCFLFFEALQNPSLPTVLQSGHFEKFPYQGWGPYCCCYSTLFLPLNHSGSCLTLHMVVR